MGTRRLALPSIKEQLKIAKHVISIKEKFDALSAEAQMAVELLKERRSALISAAVTGKIDVRNWQASAESEAESYAMAAEPKAAYESKSS